MTHIEGEVNPVRDFDIISEELRLKDIEFLNIHVDKLEKLMRGNDKKLKPEYVSTRISLHTPSRPLTLKLCPMILLYHRIPSL